MRSTPMRGGGAVTPPPTFPPSHRPLMLSRTSLLVSTATLTTLRSMHRASLLLPACTHMRSALCTAVRRIQLPTEGAMHTPGESSLSVGSSATLPGKETWSQFSRKVRHNRRRIRVTDVAAKMSYEYQMLKKMCCRRPAMRQWAVRDDFCDMSPGVVTMSPSMQAAYMKVFRLKDKGLIRRCLRDIIPVIDFRNRHERAHGTAAALLSPAEMIPSGEPDTLNQKKRELFERAAVAENFRPLRLHDHRSQAKLRFKIRQRLLSFQRQLAVANAVASRSVLYSSDDALGYFLFRGAAMYAGLHRVLFELTKLLPHFCPRRMLDFGAGTGTAILVAKEVFDPAGLAYPLYRSLRQGMTHNISAESHQRAELRYDLHRLERNRAARRRARFMAVAALLERGEVLPSELPAALRREIASVAQSAMAARRGREQRSSWTRATAACWRGDVVNGTEWDDDESAVMQRTVRRGGESGAAVVCEDVRDSWPGEDHDPEEDINKHTHPTSNTNNRDRDSAADDENEETMYEKDAHGSSKTWWERFIDAESNDAWRSKEERAHARLRPLQEITAIEPSPGMMEMGTMVLHSDVPNVTWRRYLMPEDETAPHDLVVAAYTLSELANDEARARAVRQLWKMTAGVLIFIEFANAANFDMLMTARDAILEHKDVGLWDWQPTIVGPCPHEARCPLRHGKLGVKRKSMRVCQTEAHYRATFVEVWARRMPLKVGIEPISYLIFARNELVPERAERRRRAAQTAAAQAVQARQMAQRRLYEAGLSVGDVVFERLSEEAQHRPQTGVPPRLPHALASDANGSASNDVGRGEGGDVRSELNALSPTSIMTPDELGNSTEERVSHVSRIHSRNNSSCSDDSSNSSNNNDKDSVVGHLPMDKPRIVVTSADRVNRLIFPRSYPPATHRFNRGFVDAGYQRQRAIRPAEMLLVRAEVAQLRRRVRLEVSRYYRLVRDPVCRGKIQATFCTPDATLITARVYRRFYGDRQGGARHSTMRWQHMGGWKLLRRIRAGSLFPHNCPLYAVRTVPQLDFPNTLLGKRGRRGESHVAQTAMQLNDPLLGEKQQATMEQPQAHIDSDENNSSKNDSSKGTINGAGESHESDAYAADLTSEEARAERRRRRDAALYEKAQHMLEELFGTHVARQEAPVGVDGRREITPERWAEAVRRARVRTVQQTKLAIPQAARVRAMKRMAAAGSSSRRRQMHREMRSNRRR